MLGRTKRTMVPFAAVVAILLALTTACDEPVVGMPPGGGAQVTQTFLWGPFNLGPGEDSQGIVSQGLPRPTGAFGLQKMTFDLVDGSGNPLNRHDFHLHHAVLTTSARSARFCGYSERFAATGMERTPLDLPHAYRYMVGANDKWGAIWHFMNETAPGSPDVDVYLKYTITYEPGATTTNSRPVQPLFLDVTGCGNSEYSVPGTGGPGSVHTKSRDWTMPADGLFVASGGHLHDGGIDILEENITTNEPFCKSTPTYMDMGDHQMITSISACQHHDRVHPNDVVRVTSRYDNSMAMSGVMGIFMSYVWWGVQPAA